LANELIPWVRAHSNVTTDPSKSVVAGSSFGGLAAAYTGLTHPELFGNVLSQSGSYWWKPDFQNEESEEEFSWHARQCATRPRLPLRCFLDVGLLETWRPPRDDHPSQIIANRHMRDVLEAKGYSVQYSEFSGGHDYPCWRGSLADGLIALLGPG
jgi:enterochelin esterase-like enzyme